MSSSVLSPPPQSQEMSSKKMGVWAALTSFFLMWTFLYVVLVVFRPSWVCCVRVKDEACYVKDRDCAQKDCFDLDQGRAFVVALIITLVVMLIVWLIMATTSK